MFTIHINNRFKLAAAPANDFAPAPAMLNQGGLSERASAVD